MMLNMIRALLLVSVIGALLTSSILASLAQPSEAEAKSAFERLGCTTCHRSGGIGNSWDDIVSRYKALAGKHASLDEFVEAEVYQKVKSMLGVEVRSWSELFKTMVGYVGKKPDDPNLNVVQSYLASLLQAPEAATPPTTLTTPMSPMSPPQVTTPAPEAFRGEERLTWGVILAVVVTVITVFGALILGLLVTRR
jgi:cytochrome c551/c552